MPTATAPRENSHSTSTCNSARRIRTRNSNSQQQRRRRRGGQDEDGDLWLILRRSCENESDWQGRPLHKHTRSTYSRPAERGRQIDRYGPDDHCTETTGTRERHLRDDGIVEHRATSEDSYITFVSTVTVTAVTYLGFECRSVHDGERRGITVKLTAKYVDECLDIVQLQNAKAVMTSLTEQKILNLHDETTACDQVQHS